MTRKDIAIQKILEGFELIENGLLVISNDIENGEELLKLMQDVKKSMKEIKENIN